jgi:glutamate synthase domain-containing protein 2
VVRIIFLLSVCFTIALDLLFIPIFPNVIWFLVVIIPLTLIGLNDMLQTKQAIRRNFPIIGNFRYLMEKVRPEINQYFVESNESGKPFTRMERTAVYQRAKNVRDTIAFGTQKDVYEVGYEWVNHSLTPRDVDVENLRVMVGGKDCTQPYNASVFNIGAMSYGALSRNAIISLNEGAQIGDFAHNTGEGGISAHHLHGGDLIWQLGTGYFGCRTQNGEFDAKQFEERAKQDSVKMIELKLSQGAKPGKGGILPGVKVNAEVALARGIEQGKTVVSPAAHSTFDTPLELCHFIAKLRKLSGGKPIGIKICLGKPRELIAICKAMRETDITPDFIVVDGGEGGTGAAPLEFANNIGTPLTEALIFVHNALVGFSLRDRMRVIASGKVTTGFGMIHRMCTGADIVYSSRGMMMALGCIQALRCDSNTCPTGVATQDPGLTVGLVTAHKRERVANYHRNTLYNLGQMIGAMGLDHTQQLRPYHLMRRVDNTHIMTYGEVYNFLEDGELLNKPYPPRFHRAMLGSEAGSFKCMIDE